jgi:hypothetical protein
MSAKSDAKSVVLQRLLEAMSAYFSIPSAHLATLGGEGLEAGLWNKAGLPAAHGWLIERDPRLIRRLLRSSLGYHVMHSELGRFPKAFQDAVGRETGVSGVHWDLCGTVEPEIGELTSMLPLLARAQGRCLAITVADSRESRSRREAATVRRLAESLFGAAWEDLWMALASLHRDEQFARERGGIADPEDVALREVGTLSYFLLALTALERSSGEFMVRKRGFALSRFLRFRRERSFKNIPSLVRTGRLLLMPDRIERYVYRSRISNGFRMRTYFFHLTLMDEPMALAVAGEEFARLLAGSACHLVHRDGRLVTVQSANPMPSIDSRPTPRVVPKGDKQMAPEKKESAVAAFERMESAGIKLLRIDEGDIERVRQACERDDRGDDPGDVAELRRELLQSRLTLAVITRLSTGQAISASATSEALGGSARAVGELTDMAALQGQPEVQSVGLPGFGILPGEDETSRPYRYDLARRRLWEVRLGSRKYGPAEAKSRDRQMQDQLAKELGIDISANRKQLGPALLAHLTGDFKWDTYIRWYFRVRPEERASFLVCLQTYEKIGDVETVLRRLQKRKLWKRLSKPEEGIPSPASVGDKKPKRRRQKRKKSSTPRRVTGTGAELTREQVDDIVEQVLIARKQHKEEAVKAELVARYQTDSSVIDDCVTWIMKKSKWAFVARLLLKVPKDERPGRGKELAQLLRVEHEHLISCVQKSQPWRLAKDKGSLRSS